MLYLVCIDIIATLCITNVQQIKIHIQEMLCVVQYSKIIFITLFVEEQVKTAFSIKKNYKVLSKKLMLNGKVDGIKSLLKGLLTQDRIKLRNIRITPTYSMSKQSNVSCIPKYLFTGYLILRANIQAILMQ